MKKIISALMATLVVLSSIAAAPKKSLEPIQIDLPSQKGESFTYTIDPRVEIIGIICRLAGFEMYQNTYDKNALLSQIDTIYTKYKNHKVVKTLQSYKNTKEIGDDAWLNFAYHIKPDFSGPVVDFKPYPKDLNPELQKLTAKQLNDLVVLVHDFVLETNFQRICVINNSTYIGDLGWMKEDLEKASISQWSNQFFNDSIASNVTITISRFISGNCYDYATNPNGGRDCYITIYPGTYLYPLVTTYCNLYTQDYADRNWEKVKTNFTKYIKDFNKKTNPADADKIDKKEVYSFNLAWIISCYCVLDYWKYRGQYQTEEDIQKYGDFQQGYDSLYQNLEKSFGNAASEAINLLAKYNTNRDIYPDLKSFEENINDYVNTLKVE